MIESVRISKTDEKVSYEILDPEYGTITAVGSMPRNEFEAIKILFRMDLKMEEPISSSNCSHMKKSHELLDYLVILMIHSDLIFDERFKKYGS